MLIYSKLHEKNHVITHYMKRFEMVQQKQTHEYHAITEKLRHPSDTTPCKARA